MPSQPALLVAAILASLAAVAPLHAQPAVPADPAPVGSPDVLPEKIEPDRPIGEPPPTDAPQSETLSDELSRTGGVIEPGPNLDPEMVEPPPDGGAATTPVIPPPAPAPPPATE